MRHIINLRRVSFIFCFEISLLFLCDTTYHHHDAHSKIVTHCLFLLLHAMHILLWSVIYKKGRRRRRWRNNLSDSSFSLSPPILDIYFPVMTKNKLLHEEFQWSLPHVVIQCATTHNEKGRDREKILVIIITDVAGKTLAQPSGAHRH